eukprot:1781269-Rhodomonas_salina.5
MRVWRCEARDKRRMPRANSAGNVVSCVGFRRGRREIRACVQGHAQAESGDTRRQKADAYVCSGCHAVCGTDTGYAQAFGEAKKLMNAAVKSAMRLRARYAMSGTDVAYGLRARCAMPGTDTRCYQPMRVLCDAWCGPSV